MNKKQNIKNLYKQVHNKSKMIKAVADDLKKEIPSLKNTWFSSAMGFAVPKKYQVRVITLMQNYIKQQKLWTK